MVRTNSEQIKINEMQITFKEVFMKKELNKYPYNGITKDEIKNFPISQIAEQVCISRPTVYKILKMKLGYVPNKLIKIS